MDEAARLPWVDEDVIADRYPILYHYTRATSLEPILTSHGMRATHFAHTNDAEEFYGLRSLFPDLMYEPALALAKRLRARGAFRRAPSNAALRRIIPADAQTFHDAMVRALPLPFHITCFSKHTSAHHNENGLLTLWRFYGGDGEGIALGFNTRKLIEATYSIQRTHAVSEIYLDQVGYGGEDDVLRARLADAPGLVEMFLEYMESLINGRELGFGTRQREMHQFIVLAACAKHPDFVDEREVRLVVTPAVKGHEDGRKSALESDTRYMLLPYLQALVRVIVGPSRNQGVLAEQVRTTLGHCGFEAVQVDRSRTPFRFLQR